METRAKRRRKLAPEFPAGDALGVILSFLSTLDVLGGRLPLVCKEWWHVLCERPHAWPPVLDMWSMHKEDGNLYAYTKYAWNRITVCGCTFGGVRVSVRAHRFSGPRGSALTWGSVPRPRGCLYCVT